MADDLYPPGVELRDWEDHPKLRGNIFDGMKTTVAKQFPQSYGGVRLELHNLDYDNQDPFTLDDQKEALMKGDYLHRKLRGTFRLFDEKTGDLLDEQHQTVMKVPYLTDRGTFIHGGSEYATVHQARLLPGAYTRRKESGEIETHFNTKRGTGHSFRIRLEPETGLFKMDIGQASLRLHSLLKDIGVPDEELLKQWGPEVLKINQDGYDRRVFEKGYQRLVRKPDPAANNEQKQQAIHKALSDTRLHIGTMQKTMPELLDHRKQAAAADGHGKKIYSCGCVSNCRCPGPHGPPTHIDGVCPLCQDKQASAFQAGGPTTSGNAISGSAPNDAPDTAFQNPPDLSPPDAGQEHQGVSKEDLIAIALFLNQQFDAGIDINESLGQLTDDIRAVIHSEMPGINPGVSTALSSNFGKQAAAVRTKAELDAAAHRAATSEKNRRKLPTKPQQHAGNYRKGHVRLHGLDIAVENPKGSWRKGTSRQGVPWKTKMKAHYGYIKRTEGADGDHLDVFIGPDLLTDNVWVINQVDPHTGRFDEHKVILGCATKEKARDLYLANYQPGWRGLGSIYRADIHDFRKQLPDVDLKREFKPAPGS